MKGTTPNGAHAWCALKSDEGITFTAANEAKRLRPDSGLFCREEFSREYNATKFLVHRDSDGGIRMRMQFGAKKYLRVPGSATSFFATLDTPHENMSHEFFVGEVLIFEELFSCE